MPFAISKMVLLAPVAYPTPTPVAGLNALGLGSAIPSALAPAVGATLANVILDQAYADPSAITPSQRVGYAQKLSTSAQLRAFLEHAHNLDTPADPAPNYTQIQTETVVLWGQQDPFLPFAHGQQLTSGAGLPRSTLRPIANCGHIVHEERPNDAIVELLAFLP